MFRLPIFTFLLMAALCLAAPYAAQAQNGLTEESIRVFSEEGKTVFKKTFEQYRTFIERAMHDDYKANILTTVRQPLEAPIEMPLTLNKKNTLDMARESYDSMQGATITEKIESIVISPDKKSAIVKSRLTIINQQIIPAQSMSSMLADTTTQCTDEIVYTPTTGIQVLKSDNISEMTIKQEQEL